MSEIQRDVDHLIDTARTLHLDKVFSLIRDALAAEMAEGKIRKVPYYVMFTTFYGLITFPFLTKNLYVSWFRMNDDEFREMLAEWKKYFLRQMENLLLE